MGPRLPFGGPWPFHTAVPLCPMRQASTRSPEPWVGFGLAEPTSRGMAGADLLVAYNTSSGAVVKDMYATANGPPVPDVCQHWDLTGWQQDSESVVLEVTRTLLTVPDRQDRSIRDDGNPTRILGAVGSSPSSSPELMGYHWGEARYGRMIW